MAAYLECLERLGLPLAMVHSVLCRKMVHFSVLNREKLRSHIVHSASCVKQLQMLEDYSLVPSTMKPYAAAVSSCHRG